MFKVAALTEFSCSATTRISSSNYLAFLQLIDQLCDVFDHNAGFALRRLHNLQGRQTRCDIDAEIGWRHLIDRFFFALMAWQGGVARLVQRSPW